MKLQVVGNYVRVLRAIGQDLKQFFPESLQIVMGADEIVVRGRGRRRISTHEKKPDKTALQSLWQKLSRQHPHTDDSRAEPSHNEFVRTYTPDDIDRLDDTGKARRTGPSQSPDLYSLEERVRMIGRIVDEKNAELLSIRLDVNDVIFEYRHRQGEVYREAYSTIDFYKLQQQYSSEREPTPQDPWQQARVRG